MFRIRIRRIEKNFRFTKLGIPTVEVSKAITMVKITNLSEIGQEGGLSLAFSGSFTWLRAIWGCCVAVALAVLGLGAPAVA